MSSVGASDETISRNSLESEFGRGVARNIDRALRGKALKMIPDHENLMVGDVILSKTTKLTPSEWHQRRLGRYTQEQAAWSHAMLYVGRLHVVEFRTFNARGLASGIVVNPLTKHSPDVEFKICRRSNYDKIRKFSSSRRAAALYALLDQAVHRRRYDFKRIAALASEGKRWEGVVRALFPSDFERAMICSEFVLECLAINGILTIDYLTMIENGTYFLPADFYAHSLLDKLDMKFKTYTGRSTEK